MTYQEKAELIRNTLNTTIVVNEDKTPNYRLDMVARMVLESGDNAPFFEVNLYDLSIECGVRRAELPATWYLDAESVQGIVRRGVMAGDASDTIKREILELVLQERGFIEMKLKHVEILNQSCDYAWS